MKFEYDKDLIKDVRISTSFGKSSLENGMKSILEGTHLDFEIKPARTVALFLKDEKPKVDWSNVVPTRRDFNVSGIVRDKKTGETLPFANVLLKNSSNGVTTNIDGYFTLFNVPTDTVMLLVSYIGYQTHQFRLNPASDIEKIEILMEDFGVQLEVVIVKSTKEKQMLSASSGVSRIGVAPSALAKLPSYGEKDIFRIFS